jgi:hypothetical protein
MATVSVVNSGGTVDVTRAGDTIPSVRILASYLIPTVGDMVEIIKTAGGWVCIGVLATTTPTPQWVTASLVSGYTTNGINKGVVQYRRYVDRGNTWIEWYGGMSWATSGTPPNSGVWFTMPSGFRPPLEQTTPAAGGGDIPKIDFRTNGDCVIVQRVSSTLTTWMSVSGIRYRID